jgi:hypothetical protein
MREGPKKDVSREMPFFNEPFKEKLKGKDTLWCFKGFSVRIQREPRFVCPYYKALRVLFERRSLMWKQQRKTERF